MKLRFSSDGKFKILHMTDVQESIKVSPNTVKLITTAIKKVNPDLVVFTGDQIKNYGLGFSTKKGPVFAKRLIDDIFGPINDMGVPFTVTFGNHDVCKYVSKELQLELYRRFDMYVGADETGFDGGTFTVPIYSSADENKVAYLIYLIDSQGNNSGGGYEAPLPEQIEWYKKTRDTFEKKYGSVVPSMVFQHIPVCEMYNIFKQVPKGTKNAVRAYRAHNNEYFLLDENKCFEMNSFKEPASIPDENTGEFEAMKQKGDVKALFFGHDHKNSFVGVHDGIAMGFTSSCGFNTYGDGVNRGAREITLSEDNFDKFDTKFYTYTDLCGNKLRRPLYNALLNWLPTSPSDAVPKLTRLGLRLLILAAVIVGIVFLIKGLL